MVVKRTAKSTKDDRCYLALSLRYRDTCRGRGILKREGQEEEEGADAFLIRTLEDGDLSKVVDTDDGDGGGDGPGKRDNKSRRT